MNKMKCDKCSYEFPIESVKIQESLVDLNNIKVVLVYFMCPSCKEVYKVSIQDKRYYDLKEDFDKAEKRYRKNLNKRNREQVRILYNAMMKKKERLLNYVDAVNNAFNGKFVFEDGIIKYIN